MPFKVLKACCFRLFHKFRIKFLIPRHKRHIHKGPILLCHRTFKEPAAIKKIIKNLCLLLIVLFYRLKPPLFFQPPENFSTNIDAIGWRCIVHRTIVRVNFVAHHCRCARQYILRYQILTDNADHNPSRSYILLDTAINHPVLCNVNRLGKKA